MSLFEEGTERLICAWQCTVDFETFQRVLNRPGGFRDPGEPDEYCRGFQVFDKDMTGFIGVGQLKYILTNLGEKMTDDEVDELLKAVDTSSGQVNYQGTFNSASSACMCTRQDMMADTQFAQISSGRSLRTRRETTNDTKARRRGNVRERGDCAVWWKARTWHRRIYCMDFVRDWPAFTAFVADE